MFYASILAAYPTGWLREQEVHGKFVSEGGVLGDPAWFKGKVLPEPPSLVKARVRYWDLAATEKKVKRTGRRPDPDETVGTLFSWVKKETEDEFIIEDQVGGFLEYEGILDLIVQTAIKDGPFVPIYIEQEPGSGGKNQVAAIAKHIKENLTGYKVLGHTPREHGDKVMRANIWFAEAARGMIYMVYGNWNAGFLKQLSTFPSGRHDDKIDSVSGARLCAAPIKLWKNVPFLYIGGIKPEEEKKTEEKEEEIDNEIMQILL
jgi:predicted phage terminase large subunit-like protein